MNKKEESTLEFGDNTNKILVDIDSNFGPNDDDNNYEDKTDNNINALLDTLWKNISKLNEASSTVKIKRVTQVSENEEELDADTYYCIVNKQNTQNHPPVVQKLCYVDSKKNALSLEFTNDDCNKKVASEIVKLEEDSYLELSNTELKDLITNNTVYNPRPIISLEMQTAFVEAYNTIKNDLDQSPARIIGKHRKEKLSLEANRALAEKLNAVAEVILNPKPNAKEQGEALGNALYKLNKANEKYELTFGKRHARGIGFVIAAVVAAVLFCGIAALVIGLTGGLAAIPAAVIGVAAAKALGIGLVAGAAGATLTGGVTGGLIGRGIFHKAVKPEVTNAIKEVENEATKLLQPN